MSLTTFTAKIVGSLAESKPILSQSGEELALGLTLLSAPNVPHNGTGGRIELLIGRAGSNQELLTWLAGTALGLYRLAIPVATTVAMDGVYEFSVWWRPAVGSPVLLYRGDVALGDAPAGTYDLVPTVTQVVTTDVTVQQSFEHTVHLDVPGSHVAVPTGDPAYAGLGIPTIVQVTCPELQGAGADPLATGAIALSYEGTRIGGSLPMTQAAEGVFRGTIPAASQAALLLLNPTGWKGQYTVTISHAGTRWLVLMPTDITFIPTGLPANELPTLAITSPGAAATLLPGTTQVAFTAHDDDGTLTVDNFVGLLAGTPTAAVPVISSGSGTSDVVGTIPVELTTVGAHTLGVRVTDNLQGVATSTVAVTVAQPTLAIVAPASGSTVDESAQLVTFSCTPSMPSGTSVRVYSVSGETETLLGTGTLGGGFQTAQLSAGSMTFRAKITTAAGVVTSPDRTFTVAAQSPTVAITSPTASLRVPLAALSVSLTVTHPSALPADLVVQVSLDDETFASPIVATHATGTTWTASVTIATEAVHTIRARAHDVTTPAAWISATPVAVNSVIPAMTAFLAPATSTTRVVTFTTAPAGNGEVVSYCVTDNTTTPPTAEQFSGTSPTTITTTTDGPHVLRAFGRTSDGILVAPIIHTTVVFATVASAFEVLSVAGDNYTCRWTYDFATAGQLADWQGVGAITLVHDPAGDGSTGTMSTTGGGGQTAWTVRWRTDAIINSVAVRGSYGGSTALHVFCNTDPSWNGTEWNPTPAIGGLDSGGQFYAMVDAVYTTGTGHSPPTSGAWYTWTLALDGTHLSFRRNDVSAYNPITTYTRVTGRRLAIGCVSGASSWSSAVIEGVVTLTGAPADPRALVTGVACLGTSIMDSGNMYAKINAWIVGPSTDLSWPAMPINVPSEPHCLREQVTSALALNGYNCAILDGDSAAASYILQTLPAEDCATELAVQLDRLLAAGWTVFYQYRGVGQSGSISFGPDLRPWISAMLAARPAVHVVDIWALGDQSDDPTHVIPGTGGTTVGNMYSDPLPTMDHYSGTGSTMVSTETKRIFDINAREY